MGKPTYAERAQQYLLAGRHQDALDAANKYLRNNPQCEVTRNNKGAALLKLGWWNEAREQFLRAPNSLQAQQSLAMMATYDGKREEAETRFLSLLARNPADAQLHHDYGSMLLLNGEWEQGWDEYEWRWLTPGITSRPDLDKEWKGGPIASLLLDTEQGFGDNVMFLRYADLIDTRKILVAKPEWRPILGTCPYVHEAPRMCEAEAWVSLGSLPRRLHPAPLTREKYLRCPVPAYDFGDGFHVGLVWRGNKKHKHDSWRSMDAETLLPLISIPGVNFLDLQVPEEDTPFQLSRPPLRDYIDTARSLLGLDLLITVDTGIAHLAGALGVKTWVMLSHIVDWRHGLTGDVSPWYSSWRLFRQPRPLDWRPVISNVKSALEAEVIAHARLS